jgi:hypothetical protein
MRTALLCLALLAAQPLAADQSYLSALPAGRVKVDVMKAVTVPRAAELTAKLQAAVQRDQEQWLSDVRQANAGERLAWDERLGLTREERDELQRVSGEVTFVKDAEAEVTFVQLPDGRVALQPDSSLPELVGVVLDVTHDAVDTPFGRTAERSDVTSSADPRAEGAWSGVEWKLEAPGEELGTGTLVKLAIGRMADDGRVILKYDAKHVQSNQMPQRANCVIVLSMN